MSSKAAYRYALSFLDNAIEKKNLSSVTEDFELVDKTLDANSILVKTISSPVIKPNVKISILAEVFESRVTKDSILFLKFLVEKNRENILHQIVKSFLKLKDEHLGIINVEVKSAFEFTDAQSEQLKRKLENQFKKTINLSFTIDSNLIGGFVAKIGDTVFDASLSHQLDLLKKQLLAGGASRN